MLLLDHSNCGVAQRTERCLSPGVRCLVDVSRGHIEQQKKPGKKYEKCNRYGSIRSESSAKRLVSYVNITEVGGSTPPSATIFDLRCLAQLAEHGVAPKGETEVEVRLLWQRPVSTPSSSIDRTAGHKVRPMQSGSAIPDGTRT